MDLVASWHVECSQTREERPVSPALASRILSTAPPGKSSSKFLKNLDEGPIPRIKLSPVSAENTAGEVQRLQGWKPESSLSLVPVGPEKRVFTKHLLFITR